MNEQETKDELSYHQNQFLLDEKRGFGWWQFKVKSRVANRPLKHRIVPYSAMKWCLDTGLCWSRISDSSQTSIYFRCISFVSIEFGFKTVIYLAAGNSIVRPNHNNCIVAA